MDSHEVLLVLLLMVTIAVVNTGSGQTEVIWRKPVPQGVVEITGISAVGGIVGLKDGSLMLAQGKSYRLSTDSGRTWGESHSLNAPLAVRGMLHLKSGALVIWGRQEGNACMSLSEDEGQTWREPSAIPGWSLYHSMIQLGTGRLLLTKIWQEVAYDYVEGQMNSVHPELDYNEKSAYGLWRGQRIQVEGHAHVPEMNGSMVYRSDDEGQTWPKHPGSLMGWFDFAGIPNGYCGHTPCDEPTIAETKDGSVLLIARSTVGRLVQSSSRDGGEHWYAVRPTELASANSPAQLIRIPQTGDLLIVWNQVSREEIRRGYRRGRLSAAISKDGGHSWQNFKTLELSEGLADIDRVLPEYPIQMVRARDWVGPLPEAWAFFHYANIDVVEDQVFIRYSRGTPLLGVAEQNLHKQEAVMRVYPLEYFYR